MRNANTGPGVTELPDANNDPRAYWVTQQAVLEGELARFQALAETDPEAARQLQATDAQLQAVTQRIRNHDIEKAEELAEEEEAQSQGRKQLCYFMIVLAAGLLAIAVWALT